MAFETITMNVAGTCRHGTMCGRDYLVVPVAMMEEGVLNGSNGPLFYPREEIERSVMAWNMMPVVVYHPKNPDGTGRSARDPDIITNRGVGMLMNTRFDGKLRAEAWLETDRCEKVDDRVVQNIESDTITEVSTGLFTDNEPVENGEHNGTPYAAIARNFRPDHLAILPDMPGAYSVASGGGLLQLNEAYGGMRRRLDAWTDAITSNLSHAAVNDGLHRAVQKRFGEDAWLADVYDDKFLFTNKDDLFVLGYTVDGDVVTLAEGEPERAVRVREYRTESGAFIGNSATPTKEENPMARKEQIDGLITNGPWEEGDRKMLEDLSDEKFAAMIPTDNGAATTDNGAATTAKPAATPGGGKVTTVTTTAAPPAPALNAEDRAALDYGRAAMQAECKALRDTITANEQNTLTPEQLAAMDLNQLRPLAALARKPNAPTPVANWAGAAPAPPAPAAPQEVAPLGRPVMNFSS